MVGKAAHDENDDDASDVDGDDAVGVDVDKDRKHVVGAVVDDCCYSARVPPVAGHNGDVDERMSWRTRPELRGVPGTCDSDDLDSCCGCVGMVACCRKERKRGVQQNGTLCLCFERVGRSG